MAVILVPGLSSAASHNPEQLFEPKLPPPLSETLTACSCCDTPIEGEGGRRSALLAVGAADGSVAFLRYAEAHQDFLVQSVRVAREAVCAIRGRMVQVRSAGRATPVFLIVSGRQVTAVEPERSTALATALLPHPSGNYELIAPSSWRAVLVWDGRHAHVVTPSSESGEFALRWEIVQLRGDPIGICTSSHEVLFIGNHSVSHLGEDGQLIDRPISARPDDIREGLHPCAATGNSILLGYEDETGSRLLILRRESDQWRAARSGLLPGTLSVAETSNDTTAILGGSTPSGGGHSIGWLATVAASGRITATSEHPVPVDHVAKVGPYIAAHGAESSLSIYTQDLRPLWDSASWVTPVGLSTGDFDADGHLDIAVVGTTEHRPRAWEIDSLRVFLNRPDLLLGATREGARLLSTEGHVTLYLNRTGQARQELAALRRRASDWFGRVEPDSAVWAASRARGYAAMVGDTSQVRALTEFIAEARGLPTRRDGTLLTSLVLFAVAIGLSAGPWRLRSQRNSGILLAVLLALGVSAWATLGHIRYSPLLLVGAACVGATWITRRRIEPRKKRPGASVEQLADTALAFIHGSKGDFQPSGEATSDFARKNLTKLAYLSEGMLNAREDPERFAKLRAMLERHAETFDKAVVPQAATIRQLSSKAGLAENHAVRLASSVEKLSRTLRTIIKERGDTPSRSQKHLEDLLNARANAVEAADALWEAVSANPGCSLSAVVDDVVQQTADQFRETGVTLTVRQHVASSSDAVAIRRFELFNIIENLVTNALAVVQQTPTKSVLIETEQRDQHVVVRVEDTGPGMSSQQADSAFREKESPRQGGFGLPYSRRVLREHGGDLLIERTSPGDGTALACILRRWNADGR